MRDHSLEQLQKDVGTARTAIRGVLTSGVAYWACPHCGGSRHHAGPAWWSANMLREAAGVDGPAAMIAINDMVGDGTLEQDSRLRVRLADG